MTPTLSLSGSGVHVPGWVTLIIAVTALAFSTAALVIGLVGTASAWPAGAMMGGNGAGPGTVGMMGGGSGMMSGGGGMMSGEWNTAGPQPRSAGFVAGTAAAPRIVRLTAGPGFAFNPSTISVVQGETVTFVVTTMGPTAHEFMVGPADAVAADREGTPEIADIGMMATKSLTYTFDGSGPYAFACHAAGHYEAGMRGSIVVLPA